MRDPASKPTFRERALAAATGGAVMLLLVFAVVRSPFLAARIGWSLLAVMVAAEFMAIWWRGFSWLFSRRALRFYAWLLVGAISLLVLFYAEEGWRGKRGWTRLQRETAARGQRLDLASVIPPPVPEDQNFAAAPAFKQLLQSAGPNLWDSPGRFDTGSPELSGINWLWQEPTDLAAWQRYFQSLSASNEILAPASRAGSSAPAEEVLSALRKSERAFSELSAAAQRPQARLPVAYENGWFTQLDLSAGLGRLQGAVRLLSLRAVAEGTLGQTDAALRDVQLALRLADTLRHEPVFPLHLRRQEMVLQCLQPVWEGLVAHRWSEAQLALLQQQFQGLDFLAEYHTAMRGDTLMTLNLCDQVLALATGHSARLGPQPPPEKFSGQLAVLALKLFYPVGWLYQDKVWTYRFYEQHARAVDPRARRVAPPGPDPDFSRIMDPMFIIFMVPKLRETHRFSLESFPFLQTVANEAALACALERFRLAQGGYPKTLQALVPDYLAQVPADIMTGQPLNYEPTPAGQFTLYSVGANREDDHADPSPARWDWQERQFLWPNLRRGDWVWAFPAPGPAGNKSTN